MLILKAKMKRSKRELSLSEQTVALIPAAFREQYTSINALVQMVINGRDTPDMLVHVTANLNDMRLQAINAYIEHYQTVGRFEGINNIKAQIAEYEQEHGNQSAPKSLYEHLEMLPVITEKKLTQLKALQAKTEYHVANNIPSYM